MHWNSSWVVHSDLANLGGIWFRFLPKEILFKKKNVSEQSTSVDSNTLSTKVFIVDKTLHAKNFNIIKS